MYLYIHGIIIQVNAAGFFAGIIGSFRRSKSVQNNVPGNFPEDVIDPIDAWRICGAAIPGINTAAII